MDALEPESLHNLAEDLHIAASALERIVAGGVEVNFEAWSASMGKWS